MFFGSIGKDGMEEPKVEEVKSMGNQPVPLILVFPDKELVVVEGRVFVTFWEINNDGFF